MSFNELQALNRAMRQRRLTLQGLPRYEPARGFPGVGSRGNFENDGYGKNVYPDVYTYQTDLPSQQTPTSEPIDPYFQPDMQQDFEYQNAVSQSPLHGEKHPKDNPAQFTARVVNLSRVLRATGVPELIIPQNERRVFFTISVTVAGQKLSFGAPNPPGAGITLPSNGGPFETRSQYTPTDDIWVTGTAGVVVTAYEGRPAPNSK